MSSEEQTQIRKKQIQIMDECIQDAKYIAIKNGINQEEVVAILAAALFKKRVTPNNIE